MSGDATFSAVFGGTSVTTSVDIFEITAPTNGTCKLISCRIGCESIAEQFIEVLIERATGSGSGGSAATERLIQGPTGATAAAAVEVNNGTVATGKTVLVEDAFNSLSGWLWAPTPQEFITLGGGDIVVVNFPSTITATDIRATLMWMEIN